MNTGKYIFAQLIEFLPQRIFDRIVMKYEGNKYVKHFTCWNQLLVMMFGQLSNRDNRSQMTVTEKNHLIVDAYNANPSSMMAALENFSLMQADHKMVILGAMRELGEVSAEEHQRIADYLESMDIEEVWLVGEEFADTRCDYRKFHNVEEVKAAIAAHCPEGRYILIKGSNSTKLYQLPDLL